LVERMGGLSHIRGEEKGGRTNERKVLCAQGSAEKTVSRDAAALDRTSRKGKWRSDRGTLYIKNSKKRGVEKREVHF